MKSQPQPGTKEDCKNGHHTSDNQGLCWWCGTIVNPDWLDDYYGKDTTVPKKIDLKKGTNES